MLLKIKTAVSLFTSTALIVPMGGAISADLDAERDGRSLLEEIVVTDERKGSATAPGIENARRRLSRIPGAVNLVGEESFSDEYAENLGEMLNLTPGVLAQERYAEEIRLSIRGSGLSRNFHLRGIELLLDGTPITFADGSGDFQEIDSRLTRYLEVYKGGNGFDYGAATLGGAINVVTPTGRTATADRSLTVEGGSFETAKATGTLAQAGESWDLFVGATGVHSNQFRNHSTQVNGRFTANAAFQFGERAETRFYLIANHINQEIPGSLGFERALNDRKAAVQNNIDNDWARDIKSLRFINKTSIRTGRTGTLEVGAYGTLRDLDHPIFVFIDDETTDYGLFGRYSDSLTIAGLRHDITIGGFARRNTTDDDWFVNAGGKRGFQIRDTDQTASQVQGYVTDQIVLSESFALDLGLQAFSTKREFDDNFEPVNDDRKTFTALNPKLGVLWDATQSAQLWANVTRAKEPPTFSELVQRPILQFVNLKAQESWTAEIGTRGVYGPIAWDVTLYRAWLDDELLQFSVDGDIPANTFNADRTIHQGVEAGLHVQLANDLFGRAGSSLTSEFAYTLSDFYFKDDAQFGNNQLPVAIRHSLNGVLRYEEEDLFHVALSLEWAPKAPFVDFANALRATDYAVLGISAGAQLSEAISFYLDVQNVTDKPYISTFSTVIDAAAPDARLNVFTPGDGIGVFAGIKAEF